MRVMAGVGLVAAIVGIGAACQKAEQADESAHEVAMAPHAMLHPMVQTAPPVVQEAYRFAIANAEALQYIPCYCGCGRMGHTSIRSCYVKKDNPDGTLTFDDHALGCGICVDIARDAMRMMREGRELRQIQAAIRDDYSRYGRPTTIVPLSWQLGG